MALIQIPPPSSIDPKNYFAQREIPAGVWDAFAINRQDQKNLQESHLPGLRGHWATNVPNLPSRLHLLGIWMKNVAEQPGSILWAASQNGLHPNIQQMIKSELARTEKDIHSAIRQAWSYLFEAWEAKHDSFHHEWYDLKAEIDQDGWNNTIIRKYASISQPYLTVRRGSLNSTKPLEQIKNLQVNNLLDLKVEYPSDPTGLEVPDDCLFPLIRELRKNIEHALQLEMELGGYGMINIAPIIPDDKPDGDNYSRTHGLSGSIISFSSLFSRLMEMDVTLARQELEAWPEDDETVFNRLRIWAGGNNQLLPPHELGKIITGLSNDTFWDRSYRRDLLLVLAGRWGDLPNDLQQEIETKLLQGPAPWNGEEDNEYEERRAWSSLTRITWMANNGCEFTFNLKNETEKLRSSAPKWQPEYAEKAVDSNKGRIGFVKTETEYSVLLSEPLDSILSKALALSGRGEHDFLIEKDPFTGLSNNFPVRAFSTLTHAARKDEYPQWAWRSFLSSEIRKNDKPKFSALIAERICLYPSEVITSLIRPITEWLLKISAQLSTSFPKTFDKLIEKLLKVVYPQPPDSSSVIIQSSKGIDWPMEAINAPVGKIAQALCKDPRMNDTDDDEGSSSLWIKHVEGLLSLNGDLRRHALVIFSFNLNWFYATDPGWTESNLLSVLNGDKNEDSKAAWSGFLWGARVPNQNLYMLIKERLLAHVVEKTFSDRGLREVLAWIILAGWGSINEETGKRCITNSEMRNVLLHADDQFRSQILWQIKKWSKTVGTDTEPKWLGLQHEFLRDVWPRQKSVKTSTVSLGLCDLAFSNAKNFPELVGIILPLLTTIDRDHLMLPHMRNSKDTIVNLYPEQTLALLHAILPDNVSSWPYGIEKILQQISTANSTLDSDERLLELKRKWNSR